MVFLQRRVWRSPVRPNLLSLRLLLLGAASVWAGCGHGVGAAPVRTVLDSRIMGRAVVEAPLCGGEPNEESVAVRLAYSHSGVVARFVGTRVAVRLEALANPQKSGWADRFAVEVDGTRLPPLVLRKGRHDYTLAEGLGGGRMQPHLVRLTKLTEPEVGEVRFFGFATDGHRLPPPLPATRRLWIVGDSITCGYGNLGLGPHCPFDPATEDATLAYGALAARRLGAELTQVAFSGRGLWQNRDGTSTGTLPELFDRPLPSALGEAARFAAREAPHAIVVNLGTNDASALRPLDEEAFLARWKQFLAHLRARAPRAVIVLALGPMLNDAAPNHPRAREKVQRALAAAAEARHALGDDDVVLLAFPTQDGKLGYGCDYHPSAATHAQMGARLAEVLADRLHWSQDPQFGRGP